MYASQNSRLRPRFPGTTKLLSLLLITFVLFGCSSSDPATNSEENAEEPPATTAADSSEGVTTEGTQSTTEPVADPPTTGPTLADDDLAQVVSLAAGEQVEDEQGNLLAIYGFIRWPATYSDLPAAARNEFPFFGDVEALQGSSADLLALDVGVCTAGLNVDGFGTVDFFVHADADEPISTDPVLNRGVLARHPVVSPGFNFPSPADCSRGWLPALWSGDGDPAVARYLLATRSSTTAAVESYLYQWEIAELDGAQINDGQTSGAQLDGESEPFGVGQTVTFNAGLLTGTAVTVDGWAELINEPSGIEGTRLVAVSLSYCPSGTLIPQFGLGLDGWNLVSPIDSGADDTLEERDDNCFDGWMNFAVPYGAVPTGFFASDGRNLDSGYAQWSLDNAALASPS